MAQGAVIASVAEKFKLQRYALYRHAKRHVSEEFKRSIRIGPFQSEAHLRQLCADAGTSVLDNLRGIYGGVAARWLVAFEAGADDRLSVLTGKLHDNLELQARLTRELAPAPSMMISNVFMLPDFAKLQQTLLRVLAPYPEARASVVRELKAIADQRAPVEIAAEVAA